MKRRFLPLLPLLLCLAASAQTNTEFKRTQDVIYGRRPGVALTLDVFAPSKANGYGLVFMVSGGWYSSHEAIDPKFMQVFLDRGYTVFAVVHGSQPKYVITEIVEDIHRAVRFIRHNASSYKIDPGHIGIFGASAGGHLSLTMGVRGGPGQAGAKDPLDRESSAVQATACFFPPTDFLNYGKPGEDAVGVGILKDFKGAFGSGTDTAEGRQKLGREISPIYWLRSNLPPTLIIHGDADKLVPIQQAETFVAKAKEEGCTAKLVVKPGAAHGWPDLARDLPLLADWFDQYLRGIQSSTLR